MIAAAVIGAGILGTLLRFLVSRAFAGRRFPWAVLVVNVAGSLVGGVLLGATSGDLRLILLTGFCGGLTTFSTFSVETIQLLQERGPRGRKGAVPEAGRSFSGRSIALLSVAANLVMGIGAAALGFALTR